MKTKVEATNYLLKNSLNFRVELTRAEAHEVLRTMEKYNDIPYNIENIVDDFDSQCRIWIGNENSLVIYVEKYVSAAEKPLIVKSNLESAAAKYGADENSVEIKDLDNGASYIKARFWFD